MSSTYDRFKPTALKDIKERQKEVSQMTNEYENNSQNLFERKRIKADGVYDIRMFPAHPGEDSNSIEPKVVYFVPAKRKKKDEKGEFVKDKNGKEVWEDSVRAVFDAKVHGKSKHDLIDTYISLAKKQADSIYGDNEAGKKEYLAPIIGNKFSGGQYMGINPLRSFLFYGELLSKDGKETFCEFEIGKGIQKGIYNVAAIENSNDPLGTDACFTDPLEGRPVRIIVDSVSGKSNAQDYYKVSIVNETEKVSGPGGRIVNALKEYPISEEKLIWFDEKVPPLSNYRTSFRRSDLELQLKGLTLFEEKHKFNILDTQEFKDVWNYLDNLFPVEESNENIAQEQTQNSNSEDELDLMEIPELKQYIKSKKLGITILPSFDAETLRQMIRAVESGEDDSLESSNEESEVEESNHFDESNESEESNINTPSESYKDRIAKLRNQVTK